MAAAVNVPPPPPGFVLEEPEQALPSLPPGFVLEQEQSIQPSQAKNNPRGSMQQGLNLTASAARGASFGLAPKFASALGSLGAYPIIAGINFATDRPIPTLGEIYKRGVDVYSAPAKKAEEDNPVLSKIAEIGGALAGAGAISGAKGISALGNLAGRGGVLGRVGAGAMAGEAAQRVYEAGSAPVGGEGQILARPGISLGGILGGTFPAVGSGANFAIKSLTPSLKDSAGKIINLAKKHGVPLGLDDLVDSSFYQHLIQKGSKLPLAGATSSAEKQLKGFTRAVAKSIGLDDAENLTPANMDKAFEEVGKKFDRLTKGKTFSLNDDALDSLSAIEEGVNAGTYGGAEKAFNAYVDDIFRSIKGDALGGDALVRLRNKFARISRTGANPEAKQLAKDFENVLVDMIGEGAPESLKIAKHQYKNLIAIEPLAQKAQVDGFINPSLLTNRVRTVYGRNFTRGKAGDLGELAQLGQAIKQKVPDSGTAIGNVILGAATGGSIPLAYLSPGAAVAQTGLTGLGLLANRAIQSRNVNPQVLERLARPVTHSLVTASPALQRGTQAGAVLGALSAQ